MKSPYIIIQEVRIKFFYKNVCEERMIPIYTPLQWQKEPKPTHKIHQKMDSTCFGPEFSPHSRLAGRNYKAAGLPTHLARVPWLWPHQWEQAMLWSSWDQCILFHPNSTLLNRISRYFLYWDLLHSYKNIKTLQSLPLKQDCHYKCLVSQDLFYFSTNLSPIFYFYWQNISSKIIPDSWSHTEVYFP